MSHALTTALADMLKIDWRRGQVVGFTLNCEVDSLPTLHVRRHLYKDDHIDALTRSFSLLDLGESEPVPPAAFDLDAMVAQAKVNVARFIDQLAARHSRCVSHPPPKVWAAPVGQPRPDGPEIRVDRVIPSAVYAPMHHTGQPDPVMLYAGTSDSSPTCSSDWSSSSSDSSSSCSSD